MDYLINTNPSRPADAPIVNAPDRKASVPRCILERLSSRARSFSAGPFSTFLGTTRTRDRQTFAWSLLPCEIKLAVLSHLSVTHLCRLSRTSREFHRLCFDGQLWASFSVEGCNKDIRITTIEKIFANAGSHMRSINLRGCIKIMDLRYSILRNSHCTRLRTAILEGSHMRSNNVNLLVTKNTGMVHLNVSGMYTFGQAECAAIASTYSMLEILNVSWCESVSAADVIPILKGCPKLRDLSLSNANGFTDHRLCHEFFKHSENLERLVLSSCRDLSNSALGNMLHGHNPPRDISTGELCTPPRRKLRYLDISHCTLIDDLGINDIGECAPYLEALFLAGLTAVTDQSLEIVLRSAKNLAVLDLQHLEISEHLVGMLVSSPCAQTLKRLSLGKCRRVCDSGVAIILAMCPSLSYIQLNNTFITDATLEAACDTVRLRRSPSQAPYVGLTMDVSDCVVTWNGIKEVLVQNGLAAHRDISAGAESSSQIVSLKYGYMCQHVVDEHTKRMLQGNFDSANRLVRKWSTYIQNNCDPGLGVVRHRRRFRRFRIVSEPVPFDMSDDAAEDTGYEDEGDLRLRWGGSCAIM